MATWTEFAESAPELAEAIRGLVHQFGQGFGYLATVRDDGGPRVHPVSPLITHDGLFCFLIDSPKRRDLDRDGRYALHSFPPEDCDDEAYVAGRAVPVADPDRCARIAHQFRAAATVDWRLYEFLVDAAMLARRDAGGPTTDGPTTDGPTTGGPTTGGPTTGCSTSGSLAPDSGDHESAHFTIWRDPASLAPSIREAP